MTATASPAPSIRFEWRKAVNRDHRLTESDRRVLMELECYADPDGTNARPGNERIASALSTGPDSHVSRPTVERALRHGRELGYIEQTEKGGRRKVNGVTLKRASIWRLALPDDAVSSISQVMDETHVMSRDIETAELGSSITQMMVDSSDHPSSELGSSITQMMDHQFITTSSSSKDKKHSVVARANRAPKLISDDWEPNKFHESSAAKDGLNVIACASAFRKAMSGERRQNWDSAFGAFLHSVAEARSEFEFPSGESVDYIDTGDASHASVNHDVAPANASPGPAGYGRDVETVLRKVESMAGELSGSERVFAAALYAEGRNFSYIASEVDSERSRLDTLSAA